MWVYAIIFLPVAMVMDCLKQLFWNTKKMVNHESRLNQLKKKKYSYAMKWFRKQI